MAKRDFKPPWSPQQQYKFTGTLNDPGEPHQQLSFYVLAGVGAATPTGGWTKISTIDRPRRKGFTMPTGYDPLSMDVPVRFDATVDYGSFGWTPAQIEHNIQVLEWMAGRGKLYSNGSHPAQGDPPIVQVSSFAAHSQTSTNLVPPNFHSDQSGDVRWLVSNLTYDNSDTGCIRGPLGDRRRQDVTVSLIEYVAVPGAPASPKDRQQSRGNTTGFKSFTTTQAVDTIAKVCIRHGINRASLWTQVVQFNQQRLRIRSYNAHLRPGTKVQVPNSAFVT